MGDKNELLEYELAHINKDLTPELDLIDDESQVATVFNKTPATARAVNLALAHLSQAGGGPTKRYNLALPQGLFDELQGVADKRGLTVVELLRRFIKLGLLATLIEEIPDAALIIREGDTDRELMLI